mgnify:CR=1 FL=1
MIRLVSHRKISPVISCIHCPLYDHTYSSNTMENIFVCMDETNPKVSKRKVDIYDWFNCKCTYKRLF